MNEPLTIDYDPADDQPWLRPPVPVVVQIDVPPKAVSNGWGDMSWLK